MSKDGGHDDVAPSEEVAEGLEEDIVNLRNRLEDADKRAEENLRLLQRTTADFMNYRRRVEQEKEEQANLGKAQLALKILPILDDFKLALAHKDENVVDQNWVQGIELINRKLQSALEAEGITRVEAEGKEFDPWEEEAVMHIPSEEHPAGTVIEVVRDGYKMGKRVIRPAQVVVSKGKE